MAASSAISGQVSGAVNLRHADMIRTVIPSVLWVGMAGCFIGHGAFGIITKAGWVPYFAVAGIPESAAWKLMPWVGTMDVAIGFLALVRPSRALLAWGVAWATWTALLRPLSGESFFETLERAGNYGVPLALLMVAGLRGGWFTRLPAHWPELTAAVRARLAVTLRLATATLLAGHGALGFFVQKAGLTKHYAAAGFDDPARVTILVGGFELVLALLVLVRPRPGLLFGVCAWKLATECLFLISGAPAPVFEVIERFGSYTAPLALALLLLRRHATPPPAAASPVHP
jgi:hypothetical protein